MPSDKVLQEKQKYVAELADAMKSAQTLVLSEYLGLTVAQDTELRNTLRDAGVEYRVVRNRLGKLAAKEAGLDELADSFVGSTSIAYSDDIIAPAKILKKFASTHEVLQIKGGASDGKVISLDEINKLADVPDLPILYGKLVGSLVSPISGLAMMIKAIAEKAEAAGAETAAEVYEGSKSEDAETESTPVEEKTEEAVEAKTEETTSEEAPEEVATEEKVEEKEEAPAEAAE